MRLCAIADALQTRLASGNNRNLAPEEFFALLVEDEFNASQNRKPPRMPATMMAKGVLPWPEKLIAIVVDHVLWKIRNPNFGFPGNIL